MNINPFSNSLNNMMSAGSKERPGISIDTTAKVYDPSVPKAGIQGKDSWINEFNEGGLKVFKPESVADYNDHLRGNLTTVMERLGYSLGDGEELTISIGADNLITVSGFKDSAKSKALFKEMNTARAISPSGSKMEKSVTKNLYDTTFYINSSYAKEADDFSQARTRADLIRLKNTASDTVCNLTGVDLDFAKLYRDDEGRVQGYPDELGWIFRGEYNQAPQSDTDKQRYGTARSIGSIVNRLLDAGYDAIPEVGELGVSFIYGKDGALRSA